MISCTEFIPAYSELFKFLEKKGGKPAVRDFWNWLADHTLTHLRDLVRKNGIRGCWLYWSQSLQEEAADFTMELDKEAGEFTITMHWCPSKGRLLKYTHLAPYPEYCEHCDVLYRRVLEPLGFEYTLDRSQTERARCRLVVKEKRRGKISQHESSEK